MATAPQVGYARLVRILGSRTCARRPIQGRANAQESSTTLGPWGSLGFPGFPGVPGFTGDPRGSPRALGIPGDRPVSAGPSKHNWLVREQCPSPAELRLAALHNQIRHVRHFTRGLAGLPERQCCWCSNERYPGGHACSKTVVTVGQPIRGLLGEADLAVWRLCGRHGHATISDRKESALFEE